MSISKISSGVGFRDLRIFALNADGYIDATSPSVAYEGLYLSGVRDLNINDPEPRLVTHLGDDGPFALDSLPPTEPVTGRLVSGKQNDTIDALLTNTKSFAVGEMNLLGVGTNQRGFEPQVGLFAYRQAEDTDPESTSFGVRRWQFKIFPRVQAITLESGFQDTPEERAYIVRPSYVTRHIWGTAMTLATEGFLRSQLMRGVSQYKPKLIGFRADGTATVFSFSAASQAASTAKVVVWVDGVLQTSGITVTTASVTFAIAPTTLKNISIVYEVG